MEDLANYTHAGEFPFGDTVYMLFALLDPSFCLFWLDHDVSAPENAKQSVKEKLIDLTTAEMEKVPQKVLRAAMGKKNCTMVRHHSYS
ncbi:hypothetical protein LDENG_00096570 [Lucifuga dentata]|nr:hypothetical protein LDENG_00096570 [Lucifuga dentata]